MKQTGQYIKTLLEGMYMGKILLSTTSTIEGWKIIEFIDLVTARIVSGTALFTDLFANITDLTGGNSTRYQGELKDLNDQVLELIKKEAINLNANAIIGISIDYDEISGKGKQMFMVTATGTAVIAKNADKDIEEIIALVDEMNDEEMVFGRIENLRLKVLKMKRLLKRIHESQYTVELNKNIFEYYKLAGEYAKAEDLLFKILDEVIDLEVKSDLINDGINFYMYLLENKTDSELLHGNLPRNEVIDGLNILRGNQI